MTMHERAVAVMKELETALNDRNDINDARKKLEACDNFCRNLEQEPSVSQTFMGQEYVYTINEFDRIHTGFKTIIDTSASLQIPFLVFQSLGNARKFYDLLTETKVRCNELRNDWNAARRVCNREILQIHDKTIRKWQNDLKAEQKAAEKKLALEQECRDLSAQLWSTDEHVCPYNVTPENISHAKKLLDYQKGIMEGQLFFEKDIWLEVMKVKNYEAYKHASFSGREYTPKLPDFDNWHFPVTIFGKNLRCIDIWFEREDEERCVINTEQLSIANMLMRNKDYIKQGHFHDDFQTIMAWIRVTKLKLKIKTLYYDVDHEEICYIDERVKLDAPVKIFGCTVALPDCVNGGKVVKEECSCDYVDKYNMPTAF